MLKFCINYYYNCVRISPQSLNLCIGERLQTNILTLYYLWLGLDGRIYSSGFFPHQIYITFKMKKKHFFQWWRSHNLQYSMSCVEKQELKCCIAQWHFMSHLQWHLKAWYINGIVSHTDKPLLSRGLLFLQSSHLVGVGGWWGSWGKTSLSIN